MNLRNIFKRGVIAVAAIALLGGASACGNLIKTDQQTQALWYEDGELSAQKFQGCVPSATRERKGVGDAFYRYPIGDRTWSFTGRDGTDTDPITIKTKDSQEMIVKGFIKFTLTEDCESLRQFHEKIGLKYGAFFNEDGSQSAGWTRFLNDYLAVPVNAVMDSAGLQQNWRTLYSSSAAQGDFENAVQTSIGDEVDKTIGTKGVINVKLVAIETPVPPQALLDAIQKVETDRAAAEAETAKAEAELKTQKARNALAKEQYKTVEECVRVLGQQNCTALELQKGPNPPKYIPYGSQIQVREGE